jgi:hypothetical protein
MSGKERTKNDSAEDVELQGSESGTASPLSLGSFATRPSMEYFRRDGWDAAKWRGCEQGVCRV